MSSLRVSIDYDKLREALLKDKSLIEQVEWKDGSKHHILKVNIMERKEPSQFGATHFMKFDMYHKQEIQGVNYYLGDCYPINFGKGTEAQQAQQTPTNRPSEANGNDAINDLPF